MRATRVPAPRFIGAVRRRGFLDATGDLWRAHGDAFDVRIGSQRLMFLMHPDAVAQINVSSRDDFTKGKSYDGVRAYLIGSGLVGSTGDLWKRQRKLMAPFFTPRGVQAYSEIMLRDAIALSERWDNLADSDGRVDMSDEMTLITASIILTSMFSTATTDSITEIKDAVAEMIRFSGDTVKGIRMPLSVPTPRNRRYLAARTLVHGTIADVITKRRSIDEADWPADLLSRLMLARDPSTGEPMSETLLRDESITTFFAGHETTARTLAFAWYALAVNPEARARLDAELDEVLGTRTPTAADLHDLPYTLRVVKEVLRMFPAAPFYARDAITNTEIAGTAVPARTTVMLSPYWTHRHPDFWDGPEDFDPDRWGGRREADMHSHQYHPFAAGPRICIGNSFSLLESHLLLAVLAQRFSPRLAEGARPRWHMHGTLSFESGLPMLIERR
ncbi:cytochrome P450 [Microbacter sp. GSS18]|nr:cytochrome P450 [Microbacter sp. GSS18]